MCEACSKAGYKTAVISGTGLINVEGSNFSSLRFNKRQAKA
jgi:hypothetical protein